MKVQNLQNSLLRLEQFLQMNEHSMRVSLCKLMIKKQLSLEQVCERLIVSDKQEDDEKNIGKIMQKEVKKSQTSHR